MILYGTSALSPEFSTRENTVMYWCIKYTTKCNYFKSPFAVRHLLLYFTGNSSECVTDEMNIVFWNWQCKYKFILVISILYTVQYSDQ